MSDLHILPTERIPTEGELLPFDGLQEIRFRKDGELAVGLFIRDTDSKTVVGLLNENLKNGSSVVFEVMPDEANAIFEEPWSYAPAAGKMIIEETLAPETTFWANAA